MKSPLQRVRLGALVLGAVVLVAVVGYRVLGDEYDWIDALWMVVITISTVGYAENSELSSPLQLFTILVILLGMSASVYTFGGFFHMVLEGELERVMGRRRMHREIEQLRDHVIICGYGRMGRHLAADLKHQGPPLVVIDNDLQKVEEAQGHELLATHGDATEEELLLSVHVERARALVTALPTDAANVFITLTARNLNPTTQIIARAENQSTEKKLRQAGANKVVMPALIGARQMVRLITRPSTADLMELVAESSFTDLELDEIRVAEKHQLIGVSVGETEAHRTHRLLVVAVTQLDGKMVFNPDSTYHFQPNDVLMLLGHRRDIDRFREKYQA